MADPNSPTVPVGRLLLVVGALVALLAGLDGAAVFAGLHGPFQDIQFAGIHGLLTVFGFLGTVVALRRAVSAGALKSSAGWAYLAPAASVAGTVLILLQALDFPGSGSRLTPAIAWAIAMGALLTIDAFLWRESPATATVIQGLGALAGLVGIILWGIGVPQWIAVPWWLLFLVLAIVGERVKLARASFGDGAAHRVLVESVLAFIVLGLSFIQPVLIYPFFGMALVVLLIDVMLHDAPLKAMDAKGEAKFTATATLAAYAWGILAGILWVLYGPLDFGFPYDAVIHAVTIGFAFSMLMAHAPIIAPAVTGKDVPYSPAMWVIWGILQVGLVTRIAASTHELEWLWRVGGIADIASILAFVIMLVVLVVISGRKAKKATTSA